MNATMLSRRALCPMASLTVASIIVTLAGGCRENVPSSIPKGVEYTVVDDRIVDGIKRSVDVRLNRKVSEDVLRSIALTLRDSGPRTYQQTGISYYLPHMNIGHGMWATAHFNPNLEVQILGFTAEEEQALKDQPEDPSRELIGSWLDNTPNSLGKITVFRDSGKVLLEYKSKDGTTWSKPVVQVPDSTGQRFQDEDGSEFGEYYLINSEGNLELWDRDGLILTANDIR